MSSDTRPSPRRAGSYILVSSSAPLDESETLPLQYPPRSRPRLFFLLPFVAALDIALAITLGVLVLRQEAKHNESDARRPGHPPTHDLILSSSLFAPEPQLDESAWQRRKIVLLVIAFSITRALAYAMVGFSKRIRQLGVTVAAISILSTLFYVSIANLLFQARGKPDALVAPPPLWSSLVSPDNWRWPHAVKHFKPTMPILVGAEMAFTVIEWVLFIAVVGVKIPPGANPAEAKRWARGLADDPQYRRGVDAQTLYPSDDAEEGEEETARDVERSSASSVHAVPESDAQTRAQLASPISSLSRKEPTDGSHQPLLGATSSTPRDYGSTLSEPRTPQGRSLAHDALATHSQASVRSARSPVASTTPAQGMSRSASARSGMYSKSPGAAELGGPGRHAEAEDEEDDDERDEEGDEEAEGSDPDDIIDITPNRAVARKEARLRLARAALPERRASGGTLSTLNIFGGGGGSSGDTSSARLGDGEARGPNVFSDEAGSPVARNSRQDPNSSSLLPVMRDATSSADTSMQTSTSMTFPSSSSTRTVSTQSSSIKSKMKLPRWLKRSKRK